MRKVLQIVSAVALASTLLPSVLYLTASMDLPHVKSSMFAATVVWFIATPLWMGKKHEIDHEVVIP